MYHGACSVSVTSNMISRARILEPSAARARIRGTAVAALSSAGQPQPVPVGVLTMSTDRSNPPTRSNSSSASLANVSGVSADRSPTLGDMGLSPLLPEKALMSSRVRTRGDELRPSELVPSQHGGAAAPLQRVRRRLSLRAAPQACETRHRGAAGTDRNDRQDREPTRWPEPLLRSVATSAHRSRSGAKRTRYARREPPCRTPRGQRGRHVRTE
jgi:hypothetical protein